jgi:hypothetical protein
VHRDCHGVIDIWVFDGYQVELLSVGFGSNAAPVSACLLACLLLAASVCLMEIKGLPAVALFSSRQRERVVLVLDLPFLEQVEQSGSFQPLLFLGPQSELVTCSHV